MVLARPNVFAGVSKLAEANLFTETQCREFIQLRAFIELGMVELIYREKTENYLKELRALAGVRGQDPTIGEEIAFHQKLVSIGGNRTGEEFLKILTIAFQYIFRVKTGKKKTPCHADICDVLENGSQEDFRETMKKHLCRYIQRDA